MFLECLKNNFKILSDVIIMQFGKGVLATSMYGLKITLHPKNIYLIPKEEMNPQNKYIFASIASS